MFEIDARSKAIGGKEGKVNGKIGVNNFDGGLQNKRKNHTTLQTTFVVVRRFKMIDLLLGGGGKPCYECKGKN